MFEVLAELTETGPSLAEFPKVWAAYERLTILLERSVGRLNDSGEYGLDGCVTMPSWLRHHCSMSHRDAKQLVTRGTFLSRHPIIADAAENGKLSLGHVTAIRRNITPVVAPLFDDAQQANLVDAIAPLPVHDAEHACKVWRDRAEALADLPEPREPHAGSRTRPLRRRHPPRHLLSLDSAGATELETALATATSFDGAGDVRTHAERQADALFEICAFFNANHDRNGTPRHRPHIELVYRHDNPPTDGGCCSQAPMTGRATTIDGEPIPHHTTRAFLCDSIIRRVITGPSARLDYGRKVRVIPLPLFRTLAIRDGGCRYPGCDRQVAWCDAHHITHWEDGGTTNPPNLVLLCVRHHHQIHKPGWTIRMDPNGDIVTVTTAHGLTLTSRPRGPSPN